MIVAIGFADIGLEARFAEGNDDGIEFSQGSVYPQFHIVGMTDIVMRSQSDGPDDDGLDVMMAKNLDDLLGGPQQRIRLGHGPIRVFALLVGAS